MHVLPLDLQRNDAFVMNHRYAHHKKTSMWAKAQHEHMPFSECIGFYQEDQLKATALIFAKKTMFGLWWYIPYGPCVDYDDEALLTSTMSALTNYAKQNKVALLQFETNVPYQEHTKKGDVVEGGFNNDAIRQTLEKSNLTHVGYNYGYAGNIQPRFTYVLDLSDDLNVLHKNMHKSILSTQKKNIRRHIKVEVADASRLDVLVHYGQQLSDENDFVAKDGKTFADLLQHYQDNALYLVASMDVEAALASIQHEQDQANQAIQKHQDNPKKQGYVVEMQSLVQALEQEKNTLINLFPNQTTVDLGAGLFVHLLKHSYDLYMYTNKNLTNVSPTIAIHLKAIEILKAKGIVYHDFVGISGSINPSDPYYGLYAFKQKFGGDFIEYLGQFEAHLKPKRAKLMIDMHMFKRRVERKLVRVFKQAKRKKST